MRLLPCCLLLLCVAAPCWAAERIVTLAPHLAELVYAAGGGAKLVGVSTYTDYPDEAGKLPVVARDGKVNFEAVYKLQPDLVLAWRTGNRIADVEELKRRGFNVLVTDAAQLSDVATQIRQFGELSGTPHVAEQSAQAYESRISALRKRYATRATVPVFIEIWHEPMMTVNAGHVISEVLKLCGASNVFAEAPLYTPIVSVEQLYARQPQAVLSTFYRDAGSMHAAWRERRALQAVIANRLYVIDAALLTRMGPRLADGAQQVCEAVEHARSSHR